MVEHCQRRPLYVGVVLSTATCGGWRATRAPLALVLFVADCPAEPFSLGAFGSAARFVGTLLFAALPIAFQNCSKPVRVKQLEILACPPPGLSIIVDR
jgi:hypothetical protein